MKKLFQDSENRITLQQDAQKVEVSRSEFQKKFPEYTLPSGYSLRRWDGEFHHLFNIAGDQSLGSDIDPEALENYLKAIPYFKGLKPSPEPSKPPAVNDKWSKLESGLRGSAAWSKLFSAMSATTRCSAAGVLILSSFSLKNENDLQAGWFALREAMASQLTAPKFTEDELLFIRKTLKESGFEPGSFSL